MAFSRRREFLKDMARKGLDSRNRMTGRPCAGCGRIIETGLYCSLCLEKFRERAKMQGRRIEAMKRNDLQKIAGERHETTIMIINSDERNLNITKIVLERGLPDCKILAINNLLNAINTLISHDINLVILDADFNGVDMLSRIRSEEKFQSLPVMMMSGSTQRELVASVFSLGVQDYVTKPCSPQDLVERINKVLNANENDESFDDARSKTAFRIVLIEDDIFDLRQERDTIQHRFPCELTTAQSAAEGMRHLESHGADLILVSLDMPFVNGLKFLELLTANNRLKNIPVIIMTDTRDFAILSEIKRSAAAGYIRKPSFTEDDLAIMESKLLRR